MLIRTVHTPSSPIASTSNAKILKVGSKSENKKDGSTPPLSRFWGSFGLLIVNPKTAWQKKLSYACRMLVDERRQQRKKVLNPSLSPQLSLCRSCPSDQLARPYLHYRLLPLDKSTFSH